MRASLRLRFAMFFAACCGALTPTYAKAESWLCITDRATGFYYDERSRQWKQTNFNVEESKYVLRRSPRSETAWELQKFGEESMVPYAFCKDGFNDVGILRCNGFSAGVVLFNRNNGRFSNFSGGSYHSFDPNSDLELFRKEGSDSPFVALGRCTKI